MTTLMQWHLIDHITIKQKDIHDVLNTKALRGDD